MNAQVFGERRAVRERLLAQTAAVRPLPRVRPQVRRDGRTLGEAAVADRTAERFFSAVRAYVGGQVGRLRERLATYRTDVRLLAGMSSHVSLERARSSVRLAADATQVRLLGAGRRRRAGTRHSTAETVVGARPEAERHGAGPSAERRQSAGHASVPLDVHGSTCRRYVVLKMLLVVMVTLGVRRRLQHPRVSRVAGARWSKDALRHATVTDC